MGRNNSSTPDPQPLERARHNRRAARLGWSRLFRCLHLYSADDLLHLTTLAFGASLSMPIVLLEGLYHGEDLPTPQAPELVAGHDSPSSLRCRFSTGHHSRLSIVAASLELAATATPDPRRQGSPRRTRSSESGANSSTSTPASMIRIPSAIRSFQKKLRQRAGRGGTHGLIASIISL